MNNKECNGRAVRRSVRSITLAFIATVVCLASHISPAVAQSAMFAPHYAVSGVDAQEELAPAIQGGNWGADSRTSQPVLNLAQQANPVSVQERAAKSKVDGIQRRIAVIYPELDEPYRSIFCTIIGGVEAKIRSEVIRYAVSDSANAEKINRELHGQNVRAIIALGRQGLRIADQLEDDIAVIAGGVIWAPQSETEAVSVVSLAPDPGLLFARLKSLQASIKRVFVIYDPQQNIWLIRLAQQAAKNHGLELVVLEAADLKSAVQRYQKVLTEADPSRDALWLPQDSTTVDDTSVLPLVLKEAWNRSLLVFSSSVVHVRRGVLFSLYPDNHGLGRQLADAALDVLDSARPGSGDIIPLRNVFAAVNIRTANHLGIKLSHIQQQSFELVFPQP